MEVQEILSQAKDTITVRRVFGEPFEKDGVTVVPAAAVRGGAGGGGGEGPEGEGKGQGGGFGVAARPVGAFVIRDGAVRWEPAFDVTRIVLMGQLVGIVALLALRSIVKSRARARARIARAKT